MKKLLLATSALALIGACSPADKTAQTASTPATFAEESVQTGFTPRPIKTTGRDEWGEFGIDLVSVQEEASPGDNFFQYVNGNWLDTFQIPADQSGSYAGIWVMA